MGARRKKNPTFHDFGKFRTANSPWRAISIYYFLFAIDYFEGKFNTANSPWRVVAAHQRFTSPEQSQFQCAKAAGKKKKGERTG
jgi:hypothetical protein